MVTCAIKLFAASPPRHGTAIRQRYCDIGRLHACHRTDAVAGRGNLSHWGKVWEGAELSPQIFFHFFARDSMLYSVLYAIARPSVCPSVRLSVTRVDQVKTVEVRITQPSPQSSPMTLVS